MEPAQPINPQPPIPTEIPQNSKFSFIKNIKLWQITLLLILLIPTSAYFLSKNQSKQISTVQSSPTPTPDPTANWQTYQSNKGYSIKYPSFVKISTSTYDGLGGKVTTDNFDPIFSIYSYADGVNSKLEFNAKIESNTNIKIANQTIKRLEGIEIISDTGTLINVGPIKNNGENYMIVYSSGSKKITSEDLNTFNQMISTFTLTPLNTSNLTDPTANWKIYSGAGFSFKYPPTFYVEKNESGADYISDSKSSLDTWRSSIYGGKLQDSQLVINVLELNENFKGKIPGSMIYRMLGEPTTVPSTIFNIEGSQGVKVIYKNEEHYGIAFQDKFIWISAKPASSNLIKTFETMMSAFKLTQ